MFNYKSKLQALNEHTNLNIFNILKIKSFWTRPQFHLTQLCPFTDWKKISKISFAKSQRTVYYTKHYIHYSKIILQSTKVLVKDIKLRTPISDGSIFVYYSEYATFTKVY